METTEQARIFTVADECTVYLLARDGVMVHGLNNTDMPRAVGNDIFLAQSSRADVAIFCPGDPTDGKVAVSIFSSLKYSSQFVL